MPHISKRFLDKGEFSYIHKQLYSVIKELARTGKARVIFNELLTKTEKIMLAKRLAIIIMLDKGESSYSIEKILKVSTSTVGRMLVFYEQGLYLELLKEIKIINSFWTKLEKVLPPRVGRNRFKNFLQF